MTKPPVFYGHLSKSERKAQRGATLIIGLIMLVLITLIVISAFTMSSSNLKSVGNMQVRNETLAAANQVIEARIEGMVNSSGNFTVDPTVPLTAENVDINDDGVTDFSVQPVFTCIRVLKAANAVASDVELKNMSAASEWNTEWDISATVIDEASGASAVVHQGVKVRLKQSEKDAACP